MKKKGILSTCIILAIAIACAAIAGNSFNKKRNFVEDIVTDGTNVTEVFKLSRYNKNLKGTIGDTKVYVIQGEEEGGSVLILGGTHGNEPAGHMAAIVMLEELSVSKGTVYIIPSINASGLTHNDPLEGSPQYLHFTTPSGEQRVFHYGSRATNPIDQWPDPDIYTHTSGQSLSGSETRNLNRCYPGIKYGTLSEQVAYAVTKMINTEKIDMEIDFHESSPEYAVNNAIVAHEDALDLAALTLWDVEEDFQITLEKSPTNLHGLTHRELGDFTDTMALLMETANASQGRLHGRIDSDLVVTGKDKFYARAAKYGAVTVPYDDSGISISERCARHIACITQFAEQYQFVGDGSAISLGDMPSYKQILKNGIGHYLSSPK